MIDLTYKKIHVFQLLCCFSSEPKDTKAALWLLLDLNETETSMCILGNTFVNPAIAYNVNFELEISKWEGFVAYTTARMGREISLFMTSTWLEPITDQMQ